jgi:hypothetical protein
MLYTEAVKPQWFSAFVSVVLIGIYENLRYRPAPCAWQGTDT